MVKQNIRNGDKVRFLSPYEIYTNADDDEEEALQVRLSESELEYMSDNGVDYDEYSTDDTIFGQYPQYTVGMAGLAYENDGKVSKINILTGSTMLMHKGYLWRSEWFEVIEKKNYIPKGIVTKLFK